MHLIVQNGIYFGRIKFNWTLSGIQLYRMDQIAYSIGWNSSIDRIIEIEDIHSNFKILQMHRILYNSPIPLQHIQIFLVIEMFPAYFTTNAQIRWKNYIVTLPPYRYQYFTRIFIHRAYQQQYLHIEFSLSSLYDELEALSGCISSFQGIGVRKPTAMAESLMVSRLNPHPHKIKWGWGVQCD